MSSTTERPMAQNISSQKPVIAPNQAVSISMPFAACKSFLEGSRPPRRPNRSKPIDDMGLQEELEAWDLASDEAFDLAESDPPE
jgi:hypothetical protein